MHKYVINVVGRALGLAFGNFFSVIFIISLLLFLLWIGLVEYKFITPEDGENLLVYFIIFVVAMVPIIIIQSIFIYFANRRYIIDLETGLITFPRSDMENSVLAIILMYPYWNLMRTQTINATEIENLYLDTKRWSTKFRVVSGHTSTGKPRYRTQTTKHINYNINIVGIFGSAKLEFNERQKRDEARNAIQKCVKQYTGVNIDRKVSEFG